MDITDLEENLFAASDAKLHGGLCKTLSAIYCEVLSIFPSVEAAGPRSRSGILALCSLHVALEKTKNMLQHCSDCSKLYLAITGDSVLLKFKKAKCALEDSLKRVEDVVSQSIGYQIQDILRELEGTVLSLDPPEKQIGDDIIALLQQGKKTNNSSDKDELEAFHHAATRLGITSSRAALIERRALKKLLERACAEEDKRKESIVAYLLHLMRKYSKLFRSDLSDDNDSPRSDPCSPTIKSSVEDSGQDGNGYGPTFERQITKLRSLSLMQKNRRSRQIPFPPEELRCPISLQLMYDPVIIASGQTYERICIEKWFADGHNTCPKTQQNLCHLCLTPNVCVKGLIANWCEQNGVPIPDAPPDSHDLNYLRRLSESESPISKSMDSVSPCKSNGVKVIPLEDSAIDEEIKGNEVDDTSVQEEELDINTFQSFGNFLTVLNGGDDLGNKRKVVEQVRLLLKDDEEARTFLGANGFVEALLQFLTLAVREGNTRAQESGAMALFNLAVNNNRNKEMMLEVGVISLLEEMISNSSSHGSATALYLNLSCLEAAKPIIGSTPAVPFLIQLLEGNVEAQCKLDALHTLYNLSTIPSNIPSLLSSGVISALQSLLASEDDHRSWTEKCIAVLTNLASTQSGKEAMIVAPGLFGRLATILDSGEAIEQEHAVACLVIFCNGNEKCSQMVLQEGVIPGLVSMSVNGTTRGKEKAHKLLMLFREQREQKQSPPRIHQPLRSSSSIVSSNTPPMMPDPESKPLSKSTSRRKIGKAFSFLKKSKSTAYHC